MYKLMSAPKKQISTSPSLSPSPFHGEGEMGGEVIIRKRI